MRAPTSWVQHVLQVSLQAMMFFKLCLPWWRRPCWSIWNMARLWRLPFNALRGLLSTAPKKRWWHATVAAYLCNRRRVDGWHVWRCYPTFQSLHVVLPQHQRRRTCWKYCSEPRCWLQVMKIVRLRTGIMKFPILGESNKQQMYGSFEGYPRKNSAWFGLVSYNEPWRKFIKP